jgi:uncharacterized protein involved in response to NO
MGAALGVAAVLPFALRSAGGGALGLFHSVAQILGFLTCFVMGFLFTFVPRQTRTAGPEAWELAVAMAVPPVSVGYAFANAGGTPYVLWLGLVVVAIAFTVTRLRAGARAGAPPAVMVWIPLSLAAGAIGAVLVAVSPTLAGGGAPQAWVVGRGLLVQGLVAGLVIGVGGLVVPALTRGEAPPAPAAPARQRRALQAHRAAAAAFFASFPLEVLLHARGGLVLRAAIATVVLVGSAGLHRRPTLAGTHRWLVWLGAWLVPLGFWVGAVFPRHRGAALHVVFVGGFAQLALAIAAHVALTRGGRSDASAGSPRALRLMAALLAGAFAARLLAAADRTRVAGWLAAAGAAFTAGVVAWAVAVVPALVARSDGREGRR